MTIEEIRNDPEFATLSPEAKKIVLGKKDPKFSSLSPEAQDIVINRLNTQPDSENAETPSVVKEKPYSEVDDNPFFSAIAKGAEFIENTVVDSVKDMAYSMKGGHTTEALEGKSPEPTTFSIRELNPFFKAARTYGGETGKKFSDVGAGIIHDASNIASVVDIGRNVGKVVGKGAIAGLRKTPGAAQILQEEAITAIRGTKDKINALGSSASWDQFNSLGKFPEIPQTNVLKAISNAKKQLLKPANKDKASLELLENIEKRIKDNKGKLPLDLVDADRRSIGAFTEKVENKGKLEGLVDQIYAAYHDDLEHAAKMAGKTGQETQNLREAIEFSKKRFAAEDLSSIIEKHITPQKGSGIESINVGRIEKELRTTRKGKKIASSVDPMELREIKKTLYAHKKVPNLPPPSGNFFGSGGFWYTNGFITGALGLIGIDLSTAASIGSVASSMPWAISKLVTTEKGREFLKYASQRQMYARFPKGAAAFQAGKEILREDEEDIE